MTGYKKKRVTTKNEQQPFLQFSDSIEKRNPRIGIVIKKKTSKISLLVRFPSPKLSLTGLEMGCVHSNGGSSPIARNYHKNRANSVRDFKVIGKMKLR